MQRLTKIIRAGFVVLLAGCAADAASPLAPTGEPLGTISDAAHAGTVPGFYFLPPMVPQPVYSGSFDGGLSPRVEVCELTGAACGSVIAQWTMATGLSVSAAAEQYQVNWHTNETNLDPASHYRISVFVGTFQLGFADVDVVASGKELKNVDTGEFIPLLDGRTLPIKFRIETGIVAQVLVSPHSADIPIGDTQQFTATLVDLHGDPIAAPVAWSSSDEGVASIDADGLATGLAAGATTITATAQAASGTAILTVSNPNEPPVAVADTFEAIGNVTVPVSAPGVLANDTDPDANPLSAVPGTFTTAHGGTFTLNADGSFTYLSPAGFTGEDEVAYAVSDGVATASAVVTFVVATRVWYVGNTGVAPGDGRDASPFTTLKDAEAAALAGEAIFVFHGDGSSTGMDQGIVLKNAQSLTGQGVAANVTATLNGETVVLLDAGSAPTVTRSDAGATITLAQNNTVQGLEVASTAGAGFSGSGFGTLTVGSVSVSAVGGPSLDLASGTVAASFGALSSAGSTGAGLRLVAVAGTLSAPAGSIVGAAGTGIEVSGGNANVGYGGNVASMGPRLVSVTGRTGGALTLSGTLASTGQGILVQGNGGGTIAFTGPSKSLSTGANPGVELSANAGATVLFAGGGLTVSTTTGTGLQATGGGTLTVTGAGNALASAGGAALRVASTTIGAAGLTFRSISANGGTNGIVLENTGAMNGLQVTGTGAPGSGGTIQGMSAEGILLLGVANTLLTHVSVESNAGDGVLATGPGGLGIAGSAFTGNGGQGVRFVGSSGTSAVAVTGSTFSANRGDHFRASAAGAAVLDVGFTGNLLTGGHPSALGQGITVSASDLLPGFSGSVTYDISGNTVNGAITNAITATLGISAAGATFRGSIRNNTIGTAGAPLSCSAQGSGIAVGASGNGTHTAAVTGNALRECFDRGIDVLANDGGGALNLTATANTISLSGPFSREAFFLNAGSTSTNLFGSADSHAVCLDLGGGGALANSLTGGPSSVSDVRVRQRFATTVRLPGYADASTDVAAVSAFLSANNGGASASATVQVPPGGGFVGGGGCPQP